MAKIIGCVQVKGGAGRSTVSTNIVGTLSKQHQTAIIDCDLPQGSTSSWCALRTANGAMGNLSIATAESHNVLVSQVKRLSSLDYIVIDAPPRIEQITQTIIMIADLVVIPIGCTAVDVWATTDLLATIENFKQHKDQIDYRVLWNRYRNTRSANSLIEEIAEGGYPALNSKLGLRVAFSDAIAAGKTVNETNDKKAGDEIDALLKEVTALC